MQSSKKQTLALSAMASAILFFVACENTSFRGNQFRAPAAEQVPEPGLKSPNENDNPQAKPSAQPSPKVAESPIPAPSPGVNPISHVSPKPEQTTQPEVPSPVTTAKPPLPPGKVELNLTVTHLKGDAWWKNCLTVSLGTQVQLIGCNKDPGTQGKVVTFVANQAPACNTLKLRIDTYKNQGDTCARQQSQGTVCQGPYANSPDWSRGPETLSGRDFFKIYEAQTISTRDSLIKAVFDYPALERAMRSFTEGKANGWVRVFFEDQSPENLQAVRNNPSLWSEKGIDFDDTVFDIKGENVNFAIEGSAKTCN